MPLYMDRHDIPGVTAEAVAEAHQADLKIQDKHKCKALTYWFDEGKGIAFCLVDAPDKKAMEEMHKNSHGLIPNQIIEVEGNIVELFLGRISDPETAKNLEEFEHFIKETAFRTIIIIEIRYPLSENEKSMEIIKSNNNFIRQIVKQYDGDEVHYTDQEFMFSFTSISNSIDCAMQIQKEIKSKSNRFSKAKLNVAIGLSTGSPVTKKVEFFGDTIQQAKRLCRIAASDQILVSSSINEVYKQDNLVSADDISIKVMSPSEEKFLDQLMDSMEEVWNDESINLDIFSRRIGLSKAQLNRKVFSLTGYPPKEFIKNYRLDRALKLLKNQKGNISEIAFQCGFNNPSYFSKCFQKKYGILPSDLSK